MAPMLTIHILMQYLAIVVAIPLFDWLWRVASKEQTRLGWLIDPQMLVIAMYSFLVALSMLGVLAGLYVANRLNLIYHHYSFRMVMFYATGAMMSVVFGFSLAIVCRYIAHAKPRPMHASNHRHAKQRWYAYQLEHIGPDQYSLHFKSAGPIGFVSKCDVSLKVYPDIALTAVLALLGPGKTLVLATPNAALYWSVKRQRSKLVAEHPQIRVKPYAKPLNRIIGAFANRRNKWGLPSGKAVICRGYTITT
jgi:hypothetical protein